jgi:hypothetical protein
MYVVSFSKRKHREEKDKSSKKKGKYYRGDQELGT